MTPRRNTPTSQLASRKSRPVHEWIGGHVPAPFFVQDHVEPYRPDIVIWMELPNHLVVGQAVLAPGDNHGALARILQSAIVNPTVGEPRQPDAIRIANHDLADEVRAEVAGTIPVTVAPTPELDEHFADLKPHPATRYADFVVSDVGGGPAPDASAIIKRFKEEEFPKILVSVNMLDTGFDCPEVVSLVMARFTRSAILYRQMRGRGTRKAPHIGKTDFTIFDFVGVTDFHGDDDGDIGGGEAPGSKPPGPTEPRMLLTLDVDDQIDPASRDWLTLDENGRIVRTAEHETRAAEVGLRFESWRGGQRFDAEQARWAGLIGSRIRADAMHMDGFGDYDFDEHPFKGLGGYDQARRVFGGQSALDRLITGFNAVVFGEGAVTDSASGDDRAAP